MKEAQLTGTALGPPNPSFELEYMHFKSERAKCLMAWLYTLVRGEGIYWFYHRHVLKKAQQCCGSCCPLRKVAFM